MSKLLGYIAWLLAERSAWLLFGEWIYGKPFPTRADYEADQRCQRYLRAFFAGDHEYLKAEAARRMSPHFLAGLEAHKRFSQALAQQSERADGEE